MSSNQNKPTQSNDKTNRRSFIKKIWIGLGIVAGAETLWLTTNFLFPHRKAKKAAKKNLFIAGDVKSFKRNSITPFRNHNFFLQRAQDGGFIALSIKCTHLGCNINWEEKNNRFVCPCHSSWFKQDGEVMHPPATRPLSTHPVIIEKGVVKVNTEVLLKRNSMDDTKYVYPKKA